MEEKTYTIMWDETIRYTATVSAIDAAHAREIWGTGIEGQFVQSHISNPAIVEE